MKCLLLIIGFLISIQLYGQNIDALTGIKPSYIAGESITWALPYSSDYEQKLLLITHSYGSELIAAKYTDGDSITFDVPHKIAKKTGLLQLTLIQKERTLWKGHTKVIPDTTSISTLEAFCGPKHLLTGKKDFSMVVTTVLDQYDNPYSDGTAVSFNSLIQNKVSHDMKRMNHLVAFKRIYAPDKNGYGTASVTYQGIGHHEFRMDFYGSDPSNFSISYKRQYTYADGNQLVEFKTSVIRDNNDNVMGNGTLTYFYITDDKGRHTTVTAQIINGIAAFSIPAPSAPTTWSVHSEIPYYAESKNDLSLPFASAINSIPVSVRKQNIYVGPLKSFLDQFVKDGTSVHLTLLNEKDTFNFEQSLSKGIATFILDNKHIPSGNYTAIVEVADNTKELKYIISHE